MTAAVKNVPASEVLDEQAGPGRLGLALGVGLVAIIADQATKAIANSQLALHDPVDVFWTLEWELSHNTGSAFSIGASSGLGPVIGVVAIIISVVVLIMSRNVQLRTIGALLGLVAGGAIGNVLDRLFRTGNCGTRCDGLMRGAVIDFIDFNWWPVFNVADMCIVVGAIGLGLFGLRGDI